MATTEGTSRTPQTYLPLPPATFQILVALVDGPDVPATTGRLSTHVLDTVTGRPAPGVRIALHEIGDSARSLLKETVTNADGRTDAPILPAAEARIGQYQLEFHIDAYWDSRLHQAISNLGIDFNLNG